MNPTDARPDIAVVIPTHRRETRLAFALEALAGQTLSRERFEVIVVRDGEWDGRKVKAPDGLPVRFTDQVPAAGPAAARNRGWRSASAPLVAFTDDDCRPDPRWLEALVAEAGDDDTIIQGVTRYDPDELHIGGALSRSLEVTEPGWFQTCNIAFPQNLLERHGGFDERFPGPAGEDTDLGLRAVEGGALVRFVEGAVVSHAIFPRTLPTAVRQTLRWDVVPLVVARHPSQRRRLPYRFFWKEWHARLVLALAATLALRRRPWLALPAWIPYLVLFARQGYLASPRAMVRGAFDLPPKIVLDLSEIAVTARAALRHRTPML